MRRRRQGGEPSPPPLAAQGRLADPRPCSLRRTGQDQRAALAAHAPLDHDQAPRDLPLRDARGGRVRHRRRDAGPEGVGRDELVRPRDHLRARCRPRLRQVPVRALVFPAIAWAARGADSRACSCPRPLRWQLIAATMLGQGKNAYQAEVDAIAEVGRRSLASPHRLRAALTALALAARRLFPLLGQARRRPLQAPAHDPPRGPVQVSCLPSASTSASPAVD